MWLWWRAAVHPDPADPAAFAPAFTLASFAAAVLLTTLMRVRAGRWVAVAVLLLVSFAWWSPAIARADRAARAAAETRLSGEISAFTSGQPAPDAWRQPFLALRTADRAAALECVHQRFFSLTRYDEPIALQPPGFGNQVYYAGRDVDAARHAGPIGACDFIITTPALAETDKGRALAAALAGGAPLVEAARTAEVVVLKTAPIQR
jgi:hypothetical protein